MLKLKINKRTFGKWPSNLYNFKAIFFHFQTQQPFLVKCAILQVGGTYSNTFWNQKIKYHHTTGAQPRSRSEAGFSG